MPDKLPPSVPTGSARAARTAGKKLEFARQYCSQCPVPIQLISRHARSLDATRKLQRIRTHKKRHRESPKWIAVSGPLPESTDCEARSARMAAVGATSPPGRVLMKDRSPPISPVRVDQSEPNEHSLSAERKNPARHAV